MGLRAMSVSAKYDSIDFYTRVIAGAGVNIVLLQYLSILIGQNTSWSVTLSGNTATLTPIYGFLSPPLVYWFILATILFLVSPLLVSLLFSKKREDLADLRVVPPLYVAIVTIVYAALFIFGVPNLSGLNSIAKSELVSNYLLGFMSLFFFGFIAWGEDRAAVLIFGTSAERESIYFEKLRVHGQIEDVKAKFLTPEIRENLGLVKRVEGDQKLGYILRTGRRFDITSLISLREDEEEKGSVIVKIAYYEKSRYSVRFSRYFLEFTKRQSAYLYEVFTDRKPQMPTDILQELTNTSNDSFICDVLDDLRGYYVAVQKVAPLSLTLVVSSLLVAAVTVWAFLTAKPSSAIASGGLIEIFILVVGLMDYFKRRS